MLFEHSPRSPSAHSTLLLLKPFLHSHGFANHFWYKHPICLRVWRAKCSWYARHHWCTQLKPTELFILWKSKITFMQSKWESIPNTDDEGTRDHDANVLMNITQFGFKNTSGFGRASTSMGGTGRMWLQWSSKGCVSLLMQL